MAKKRSFEQSLSQLEKIVNDLEEGNLPLEKALKKFEEGINTSEYCSEILNETERKISILLGKEEREPFQSEEDE